MSTTRRAGLVWRVAPCGTAEAYLIGIRADGRAQVCSRGQVGKWAKQPMLIDPADLFDTREEARAEMRRRRNAQTPDAVMASMATETAPLPDAVASAWDSWCDQ